MLYIRTIFFILYVIGRSIIHYRCIRYTTRIYVRSISVIAAYDLATQCPSRKSIRRHTMVCILPSGDLAGSDVELQSRRTQQNGSASLTKNENLTNYALPQRSWSRSSLQDELFESVSLIDDSIEFTSYVHISVIRLFHLCIFVVFLEAMAERVFVVNFGRNRAYS